jgi:hypothetical protein
MICSGTVDAARGDIPSAHQTAFVRTSDAVSLITADCDTGLDEVFRRNIVTALPFAKNVSGQTIRIGSEDSFNHSVSWSFPECAKFEYCNEQSS